MNKITTVTAGRNRRKLRYSTSQIASVSFILIAAVYLGMRLVSLVRLFWF